MCAPQCVERNEIILVTKLERFQPTCFVKLAAHPLKRGRVPTNVRISDQPRQPWLPKAHHNPRRLEDSVPSDQTTFSMWIATDEYS